MRTVPESTCAWPRARLEWFALRQGHPQLSHFVPDDPSTEMRSGSQRAVQSSGMMRSEVRLIGLLRCSSMDVEGKRESNLMMTALERLVRRTHPRRSPMRSAFRRLVLAVREFWIHAAALAGAILSSEKAAGDRGKATHQCST